jgi:hypothetical protein
VSPADAEHYCSVGHVLLPGSEEWLRAEVERLREEKAALLKAVREAVYEGHREHCKISVGRCNCSYEDLRAMLAQIED